LIERDAARKYSKEKEQKLQTTREIYIATEKKP